MSLDCIIKIPGRDQGYAGNGRPKKTMTGPVHRFLRDSTYYYWEVFKHLQSCSKCSPEEALQGFLDNRIKRHDGNMSDLIIQMARRYKCFPGKKIPKLIRQFEIRNVFIVYGRKKTGKPSDDIRRRRLLETYRSLNKTELKVVSQMVIGTWKTGIAAFLAGETTALEFGSFTEIQESIGNFSIYEYMMNRFRTTTSDARVKFLRELEATDEATSEAMRLWKVIQVMKS